MSNPYPATALANKARNLLLVGISTDSKFCSYAAARERVYMGRMKNGVFAIFLLTFMPMLSIWVEMVEEKFLMQTGRTAVPACANT